MTCRFPINNRIGYALGAVLCALTWSHSVTAQQVSQAAPEQEVDRAESRQESLQSTLQANSAAIQAMNDPNCPEVTFADILGDPDNVELNVCYARSQVAKGDVRGAAATLERVLAIAPEAANVRMLYAVVLFRLDSVDEAEREFLEIAELELLPKDRKLIQDYLDEIERRRQKIKHTVTVSVGGYYDTNRNSAPQSEELEAAGVRGPINLAVNRPNDALGLLTIMGYDFTYDPGFQNQHEYFGGVDLYADSLSEQNRLDVHSATFDLGARLRYPGITFTPRVFVTSMRLDWAKFYQSEGIELRVDHKHKLTGLDDVPLLDTWASFTAQDEDYHNTPNFGTLTLRSGPKYTTKAGLGMLVDPSHYLSLVGTAEYKSSAPDSANNADARVFSYKYFSAEASHTWILDDGHFLISNLLLGSRQYKAADFLVTGVNGERRHEMPFRARMTYGMPLTELLGDDWLASSVNANDTFQDFFNGTTISFTGEYNYQRSNITNFQYRNKRVQMMLTRRLDF